jgi:hypothetical protein
MKNGGHKKKSIFSFLVQLASCFRTYPSLKPPTFLGMTSNRNIPSLTPKPEPLIINSLE